MTALLLFVLIPVMLSAGSISDDLSDWITGVDWLYIDSGIRADGNSGKYIGIPEGTSPFYYELLDEGEGVIEFWIRDNAVCISDSNPGYPVQGPGWGLITSDYIYIMARMYRSPEQYGCSGYSIWSAISPYESLWFNDGIRGANGSSFEAGWYKWTISAGWDDIAFTLHDVAYHAVNGPPYNDVVFGNCSQRYNGMSLGGAWERVFANGFQGFCLTGDGSGGCEAIDMYVTGGSGVFREVSDTPLPVSNGYNNAGWNDIKQLFR